MPVQYHISWEPVKYPSNKADLLLDMTVYYNIWYNIFLKNLPINTTKKCNTIKFVKSRTKCSKIKIAFQGILHLTSDWILLADVKVDFFFFPFQLALTELCPDIFLFSKSLK